MATIISIILVLSITYLNSQRYAARAKDLDANVLDLRNLQIELSVTLVEKDLLEKRKTYSGYLAASEREDEYDKLYYDVIEYFPNKDNKPKVFLLRQIQICIMVFFFFLLKVIIIFLPFIIIVFLIYSLYSDCGFFILDYCYKI